MHSKVAAASNVASLTNTTDQVLNRVLIDKIFQAILIGILKLEFVVIGQKPKKKQRLKAVRGIAGVFDVL